MNSAQASQSGAPKNVRKHRFGLVVGRVRYRNFCDQAVGNELIEKRVARTAGGIFKVSFVALSSRGHVCSSYVKWQVVLPGELGHKFLVGIGCTAPNLVIEMGNAKDDAQLPAQFEKEMKQRDRIRSARNSDSHAIAGMDKIQCLDLPKDTT